VRVGHIEGATNLADFVVDYSARSLLVLPLGQEVRGDKVIAVPWHLFNHKNNSITNT
jgi:hypothetical protein